jgi:1-acyl-sn-glycerol-3-phosphate acyltransferase
MLSANASDILAVCTLVALGLAVAVWVVLMLRRSPFSPAQSVLYAVNYLYTRLLWRLQVRGQFPIASGQGAVVVCNHRSSIDPCFIVLTVPRVVHWMVAREYCEFFLFRKLLQLCGSIPVSRGGHDMAATRSAIRIVQHGGLVGIFPEAYINTTADTLLPGRPGAALIALKARVPVVPCYIENAPYDGTTLGCLLMPASVRLTIGQPIDLSAYYDRDGDRKTLDQLTLCFLAAIAHLAGKDEFRPELAGHLGKTAKRSTARTTNEPRKR